MSTKERKRIGQTEELNAIKRVIDFTGKTALEFGPYDGLHTVKFGKRCEKVLAIEEKESLSQRTRDAVQEAGLENVEVLTQDAGTVTRDQIGVWDVLFHSGVLYHLVNPVPHLFEMATLCRELWLDTLYLLPPRSDFIEHEGIQYAGRWVKENHDKDMASYAETVFYLSGSALWQALANAGFHDFQVVKDEPRRKATNRIWLYAKGKA